MRATLGYVNEANRANRDTTNAFLSVLQERSIVVRDETLKYTGGKLFFDYNPGLGIEFESAFKDRIESMVTLGMIDLAGQRDLIGSKYGNGRHVQDLATQAKPVMTATDLRNVWIDVAKVDLQADRFISLLLFVNLFSACKFPLESASDLFLSQLDCEKCQFAPTCIMKKLARPTSSRSIDHFVAILKAAAYADGRDVVREEDIARALRLTIPHRLQLKPDALATHPSLGHWFQKEVIEILPVVTDQWKGAKKVYDELTKADVAIEDAIQKFSDYKTTATDVTGWRLVEEFAGPYLTAKTEKEYKRLRAGLDVLDRPDSSWTKDDLRELKKAYPRLIPSQRESIEEKVTNLEASLKGSTQMKRVGLNMVLAHYGRATDAVSASGNVSREGVNVSWSLTTGNPETYMVRYDLNGSVDLAVLRRAREV